MRIRLPLHWRIALAYTALIFLTMGIVSAYLVGFIEDRFYKGMEATQTNNKIPIIFPYSLPLAFESVS